MKSAFKRWDLPVVAAFFVVAIVVFHLASARAGYPFFRDQHLGAALDYAKNGINWMNPIIPGFNANGVGTPQEIPLWQALASLPLRNLGGWWGWANVVSLLLFSLGIPPVWLLARSALGERGAWWTTVAFLSQPLIFVTSGQVFVRRLCFFSGMAWPSRFFFAPNFRMKNSGSKTIRRCGLGISETGHTV